MVLYLDSWIGMLRAVVYSVAPLVLLGYLANRFYFSGGRCKSKKRLDGKIVIVTGANCGIGYETALDLAKRGAHVILACRDLKRAQIAADKIILASNNNKVEIEQLDLGSFRSIREFADRFKNRFKRLDILVNNAGLYTNDERLETKDGIEMIFGVNHLGPFLLTNLLLDLIKSSAPSRIVNVSSKAHYGCDMNWNDLVFKTDWSAMKAYKQSKLGNVLFTKYLAKKLEGTNVTTVSLHPGVVRTEIMRDLFKKTNIFGILLRIFKPLLLMLSKNCEEGAQTTLHCALDDDVPNYNGEYFSDCKMVKMSPKGADTESAERLWKISSQMVGLDEQIHL